MREQRGSRSDAAHTLDLFVRRCYNKQADMPDSSAFKVGGDTVHEVTHTIATLDWLV